MLRSLSGRCLGILSVVCVLALFFFPLAHGSFQATHGPTTTFRAKWAFLVLLFAIVAAALRVLSALVPVTALAAAGFVRIQEPSRCGPNSPVQSAILRC
jgi:TRAP-type C4-dicarboxylate transport system permease small subunit